MNQASIDSIVEAASGDLKTEILEELESDYGLGFLDEDEQIQYIGESKYGVRIKTDEINSRLGKNARSLITNKNIRLILKDKDTYIPNNIRISYANIDTLKYNDGITKDSITISTDDEYTLKVNELDIQFDEASILASPSIKFRLRAQSDSGVSVDEITSYIRPRAKIEIEINQWKSLKIENDKLNFRQIEVPNPDSIDSITQCKEKYDDLERKVEKWRSIERQYSDLRKKNDTLDSDQITIPKPDSIGSITQYEEEYGDLERRINEWESVERQYSKLNEKNGKLDSDRFNIPNPDSFSIISQCEKSYNNLERKIDEWESVERQYSELNEKNDKLDSDRFNIPNPDSFNLIDQCEKKYNKLEIKLDRWKAVEKQQSELIKKSDQLEFKEIDIPKPDSFDSIEQCENTYNELKIKVENWETVEELYTELGRWNRALDAADVNKEQTILDEIERVSEKIDSIPTTDDIKNHGIYPTSIYYSCFDSWHKALEAADINKEQALLDDLKQVAGKIGYVPTTAEIDEHGTYSSSIYISYFGSWDDAVQQSGVERRFETRSEEFREEILDILQSLHSKLDRVPELTELPKKYSINDFYTEFESWDEALEAAGIDKEQALLDDITQVAEKTGHVPISDDIDKHGTYSYSTHSSYFDSWDNALQQSGVKEGFETKSKSEKSSGKTRREMLDTLQSLHNQLGRVPKPAELSDEYSPSNFYAEFGNWDKALEAAGFDIQEEILYEIEQVADKVGRVPSATEIDKHSGYPVSNYNSYFDSWDEAIQQSGIKKRFKEESGSEKPSQEPREEMLGILQSLYDRLGRIPKPAELSDGYSPDDFYTEFGTWDKALEAAGFDIKKEILDKIETLAQSLEHVPSADYVQNHDTFPASAYELYFDSWDEALEQSGANEKFETKSDPHGSSREEMLKTIQSLHSQLGRVPKSTELPEECSQHDLYTEFGSWNEALEAAGFDVEQKIVDEINRVADEVGDIPTTTDVDKHGEYPASNYQSCFDSWDDALQQSGVNERFETKSDPHGSSREEMLKIIQSLHRQLGKVPKSTELPEEYSQHDFSAEFGAWNEALETAGINVEQEIVDEIDQLAEKLGRVPTAGYVQNHDIYPASDYESYFDSWSEALEAADVGKQQPMLNEIERIAVSLEHQPSRSEITEYGDYHTQEYKCEFNSITNAIDSASFSVDDTRKPTGPLDEAPEGDVEVPSHTNLLRELAWLSQRHGSTTAQSNFDKISSYERRHYDAQFGSVNDAFDILNETAASRTDFVPKSALKVELDELGSVLQRPPSVLEILYFGQYPISKYAEKFDSIPDLSIAAGYETPSTTDVPSTEVLLTDLQRSAANGPPTVVDYDRHGNYQFTNALRQFDSWLAALNEAGFDPLSLDINTINQLESETNRMRFETQIRLSSGLDIKPILIDELHRLRYEIDTQPTKTVITECSRYPLSVFERVFGSLERALSASDLTSSGTPNPDIDAYRTRLLESLQTLEADWGHPPTQRMVNALGAYPTISYIATFDSWNLALEKSGLSADAVPEHGAPIIVADLQRIGQSADELSTAESILEKATFGRASYAQVLGSTSSIQAAADPDTSVSKTGIQRFSDENETASEQSKSSREEMINVLHSLYDQLGRTPKPTELPEEYSPDDFHTEFGSWQEAVKRLTESRTLPESTASPTDSPAENTTSHDLIPESVLTIDDIKQDGRLDTSIVVQCNSVRVSQNERQICTVHVEDLQENTCRLNIWTKHEINIEWRENHWYLLKEARGKAWEKNGTLHRQLSSTRDLTVTSLGEQTSEETLQSAVEQAPKNHDVGAYQSDELDHSQSQNESSVESARSSLSTNEIERLLEIRGVGRPTARRILETFGTVDEAASASTHELTEIRGVGEATAARITSMTRQTDTDQGQSNSEKRSTTTGDSEMSSEDGDIDSVKILDEIADEFEEL